MKYSKLIVAVLGIGASWLADALIIPPGSEGMLVTIDALWYRLDSS